jgi:hypothetical protein
MAYRKEKLNRDSSGNRSAQELICRKSPALTRKED